MGGCSTNNLSLLPHNLGTPVRGGGSRAPALLGKLGHPSRHFDRVFAAREAVPPLNAPASPTRSSKLRPFKALLPLLDLSGDLIERCFLAFHSPGDSDLPCEFDCFIFTQSAVQLLDFSVDRSVLQVRVSGALVECENLLRKSLHFLLVDGR